MADVRMEAKISVDPSGVSTGTTKAITSLEALQNEILKVQDQLKTASDDPSFNQLATKFNALSRNIELLSKGQTSFGSIDLRPIQDANNEIAKTSTNIKSVQTSTVGLASTMNRTMHGVADLFIAPGRAALIFANDIPALITRLQALKAEQAAVAAEGGKAKSSAQLLTEAFNPLGIGISLVTIAMIHYLPKLIDYIAHTKNAESATKELYDALSKDSSYKGAISNVARLTEEVQLAKEGLISKEKVVKDYNSTMGKTAGIVNDLNGVEESLVKNGPAYIEITKQKALATAAYQKWADGVVDAQKKIGDAQREANQSISAFRELYKDDPNRLKRNLEQVGVTFQKTVKGIMEDAKANDFYKVMGDNAEKAAARRSADIGMNFFNDSGDKTKKATKPVIDALTEMDQTFAKIDRDASNHVIHFSEVTQLQFNAVKKAIEKIGDSGGDVTGLSDLQRHLQTQLLDKSVITLKFPEIKFEKPEIGKNVKAALDPITTEVKKIIINKSEELRKVVGAGAAGLAEGIGAALGSGDFSQLGEAFLGSLGSAIESFGQKVLESAIEVGVLQKTLESAISSGNWVAAAAIGASLIAAGAALAALAKRGTAAADDSAGGSFSRSTGSAYTPYTNGGRSSAAPVSQTGSISGAIQSGFENGNWSTSIKGTDIVLAYNRTTKKLGQ